jgi:ligand-binding SRPBCC domain-containing protein
MIFRIALAEETGGSTVRVRTLTTELWLPAPLTEVFAFFSDAHNLQVLTPPWLHFRILTPPPIPMHLGTRIEYRLRWHGLPLFWRTEISDWNPPLRFVDRQIRGPYRRWVHEHTFAQREGGTLMRDRVDYAVPGWLLEPLVSRLIVTPDVERIFAYRRGVMQERFAVQGGRST